MRVQIRDKNALSSLSLNNALFYLRTHGWTDEGQWGKRPASLYSFEGDDQESHVLIPHRKEGDRDYPELMSQLIETLSEVEGRSELEVYFDIEAISDIVRMRPFEGTFEVDSLSQGAGLLKDVHDVFASAARAEENPKPVYRGRASEQIIEYLNLVRPARSFGMSHSLTVYSPIPNNTLIKDDTFSRRVIVKLSDALNYTSNAIKEVMDTDSLESFKESDSHGVSANLCESLATLIEQWNGMTISIVRAEEQASNVKTEKFNFNIDYAEILEIVAKGFRDTSPSLDETITAWVVGVKREPKEFDGQADLLCERDGKSTRISAQFDKKYFKLITDAITKKYKIQVTGDVHKVGTRYQLLNPYDVKSCD